MTRKGKWEALGKEEFFYILIVVMVTQLYEFVKTHRTIHYRGRIFYHVNFTLILKRGTSKIKGSNAIM